MGINKSIPLSSTHLYHFTRTIEDLASILRNGFEYRVIQEDLPLTGFQGEVFSIPGIVRHSYEFSAVCFCDIPEYAIHDHSNQYGAYGIGLKKSWGMANGITPIRYIHYHTPDFDNDMFHTIQGVLQNLRQFDGRFSRQMAQVLKDVARLESISNEEWEMLPDKIKRVLKAMDESIVDFLMQSRRYLGLARAYDGDWKDRVTGLQATRCFYDEKEWRALRTKRDQTKLLFDASHIVCVVLQNPSEFSRLEELVNQPGDRLLKFQDIKSKICGINDLRRGSIKRRLIWERFVEFIRSSRKFTKF